MDTPQPCHVCRVKGYAFVRNDAANEALRWYCQRHFWPVYSKLFGDIGKPEPNKQPPKQLSLL